MKKNTCFFYRKRCPQQLLKMMIILNVTRFHTFLKILNGSYKDKLQKYVHVYTMTKKSSLTFLILFICAVILFSQILIAVNTFLSYIQYRLTCTVIGVVVVLFLESMSIGAGT